METTDFLIKSDVAPQGVASSNGIAEAVAKTIGWTRSQLTPKEVVFLVKEVQQMIDDDFKCYQLSANEIEEAFKKGAFGEYGQYFGINTVSLMSFVRNYVNSDDFRQHRQATAVLALPQKATVTDEALRSQKRDYCLSAIADYKKSKRMPLCTDIVFDFLYKNKILTVTSEMERRCFNTADAAIEAEKKSKKGIALRDYIVKLRDTFYSRNIRLSLAKSFALREFFDKCDDDIIYQIKSL